MRHPFTTLALFTLPMAAFADGIRVEAPYVPLAPPGVMVHAAYFTLTNDGETPRRLVALQAEGYAMAHLHMTEDDDGVATMATLGEVEIAPGQTVVFEPGGLHVMLMHPAAGLVEGDAVSLTLSFADGESAIVSVPVKRIAHGS